MTYAHADGLGLRACSIGANGKPKQTTIQQHNEPTNARSKLRDNLGCDVHFLLLSWQRLLEPVEWFPTTTHSTIGDVCRKDTTAVETIYDTMSDACEQLGNSASTTNNQTAKAINCGNFCVLTRGVSLMLVKELSACLRWRRWDACSCGLGICSPIPYPKLAIIFSCDWSRCNLTTMTTQDQNCA